MTVTERACNKCKEMKPLDGGFYRNKGMSDGLLKVCKTCCNAYSNAYKERHPEKVKGYKRAWKDRNPDADMDYYWANYDELREKQVWSRLETRYGVTREEYETLLNKQNGVCAICGGVNSDGRRLHVDHDHDSGAVRGLLCVVCNMQLGVLDKQDWCLAAYAYLGDQ